MFNRKHLPQFRLTAWQGVALFIGILLLLDLVSFLIAEGLWFAELRYLQIFTVRVRTQGMLALLAFCCSIGFLLSNLALAYQYAWSRDEAEKVWSGGRSALPGQMRLAWLLPLVVVMSLIIGIMVVYHGQIAVSHWHPNLTLYNDRASPLPLKFTLMSVWQIAQQLVTQIWQLVLVLVLAIALLVYSKYLLNAIAVLMSLGFGLVFSEHWAEVLLYFYPTAFDTPDPLFEQDIGFYVFRLPTLELVEFWLVGLLVLTLLSVGLVYLLSGDSIGQGRFPGFSSPQLRHLWGLGGGVMLAVSFSYWLSRYELLYSQQGVAYGASYTNVSAELPAFFILSIGALAIALFMLWRTLFWSAKRRIIQQRKVELKRLPAPIQSVNYAPYPSPPDDQRSVSHLLLNLLGLYLIAVAITGVAIPMVVQRLVVQPNELELERPFIERSIALTRQAFDLDKINVEDFDPQGNLTYADILENDQTVSNIRLWDTRPLLETNRQLQRIRLYYEFPDADIDRYRLVTEDGGTEVRQVLIAARELDYESVPAEAQTWINKHLIYTHGYGFTLSPVNVAGEGGLPDYFVRGIEQNVSSPRIRESIPIGRPRIYYGEMTNTYVMTQTEVRELDYPSGSDNVYNVYDGQGGIRIGPLWRRLTFAKHLRDWRMLLTDNFTPETRLLFRRNIVQRVRTLAPFLRYDNDPYLVVADAFDEEHDDYLYWIIDAYTTSDRYPYSDPLGNDFNYIRNSIKVVVDAYSGRVRFYVADPSDPVIRTWSKIFPGMFQPLDAMPPSLLSHIRYPQDYYRTQSEQLMVYHMTDPQVFYNREDQWRAPNEIYADEPQLVEPYYLIMKLPTDVDEEFILLRPFTPVQRNNLIAWLAARSDGEQYGSMLLYSFPKQQLVYGPEQIEARINQDPIISQQISLWNRRGSRAIQGNLLVIPIEQSLLYVEPLYLEAEQNRLPILARVIVVYENRIVMAETLDQSLRAIFQPEDEETPAIIRSIEELEGDLLAPLGE